MSEHFNKCGGRSENIFVLRALENLVQDGGLLHARNEYRRQVPNRTFWRKWPMYEAHLRWVKGR